MMIIMIIRSLWWMHLPPNQLSIEIIYPIYFSFNAVIAFQRMSVKFPLNLVCNKKYTLFASVCFKISHLWSFFNCMNIFHMIVIYDYTYKLSITPSKIHLLFIIVTLFWFEWLLIVQRIKLYTFYTVCMKMNLQTRIQWQ